MLGSRLQGSGSVNSGQYAVMESNKLSGALEGLRKNVA